MHAKCSILFLLLLSVVARGLSEDGKEPEGYIIYCPCMGRFGNQADHFLGSLGFAKSVNRILVLPPWRTYKNVPFDEWFQAKVVQKYHPAILAEDFMRDIAPSVWPPGNRTGWCWLREDEPLSNCKMKEGNPFGPFWDGLGVDFDNYKAYQTSYGEPEKWKELYPASKYPVLAFKGAPASFPVPEKFVDLQQYLQWSHKIEEDAEAYIQKHFPGEKFVGIHLRNGPDWERACEGCSSTYSYMASPQCLGYHSLTKVAHKICFPSKEEILRLTKNVVLNTRAKVIYVATDKDPMKKELEDHLKSLKVRVFHQDPWLPQIDLAVLGKADHFIGNCVSSFTAFVTRQRRVQGKPVSFWGHSQS